MPGNISDSDFEKQLMRNREKGVIRKRSSATFLGEVPNNRVFQPFLDSDCKIFLKLSKRTLQGTPVARWTKDGTYQLPFWLRTSSLPPVLYLCFSCSVSSCCRTNWKPAKGEQKRVQGNDGT